MARRLTGSGLHGLNRTHSGKRQVLWRSEHHYVLRRACLRHEGAGQDHYRKRD